MLVSAYGMCSKTCLPWQGRAYINDAFTDWSGETKLENGIKYGKSNYCGKWFPLLSSAISEGLFHPNCKHGIGLYIDGVTDLPKPMDNSDIERRYKEEQHQRALEREVRRAKRRVEGFSDPADIEQAKRERKEAEDELQEFIDKTNKAEGDIVLVHQPIQEKTYLGEIVDKSPSKWLTNAAGDIIIEVKKVTTTGKPNSITQRTNKKGGIDRNYYGPDGKQTKQISNYGHGHQYEETLGKHGEHAHDYYLDEQGNPQHGKGRELTDFEREENSDIL